MRPQPSHSGIADYIATHATELEPPVALLLTWHTGSFHLCHDQI